MFNIFIKYFYCNEIIIEKSILKLKNTKIKSNKINLIFKKYL